MLDCIIFKDAPVEHEDDLWIMFDSFICTHESSFDPGVASGASRSNWEPSAKY